MDLYILFGQRKENYDGEHAPEALLCWTEYDVDENGEGWEVALAETQKANSASMVATRVVRVSVNQNKIRQLLLAPPKVEGNIEE